MFGIIVLLKQTTVSKFKPSRCLHACTVFLRWKASPLIIQTYLMSLWLNKKIFVSSEVNRLGLLGKLVTELNNLCLHYDWLKS